MTAKPWKYLILIIVLVPMISYGQNRHQVDSLLTSLSKSTDNKAKCATLNQLFLKFVRTSLDSAIHYNDQCMRLAKKINYPKGISDALYNRSSVFRIRGEYDSALAVMIQAKPVFRELNDSVDFADCLAEIGSLYALKNDPKNALTYLLEALNIYKLTGKKKNLALLYNRFGTLYQSQKQLDSALNYYKKSLEINKATGFKLGSSANLINIGIIYEDKGDHEKAIEYTLQALEIKEKLGDKQGIGKCMNNIGTSYMNLGKVSKAIEYHEKALALAQEYKSNLDIARIIVNLGFDYQKGSKYNQAISFALEGLEMAQKINDIELLRESTRVLFESYGVLKKFDEAYRYHVLFKQYSDSIVNENNLKALSEIQSKYNVATKENEITALKIDKSSKELQIQTLRAWYNLAIGLFVALLALALFFYYRSRISRRLSTKLKEINDMKSHFFANLSHEFRTPLTLMLGPAEKLMENASPEDKPWLELIHRNASRLLFLDEQLLEFTKIDSGSQKIHLVSGNILVPLRSIAESYILLAEQKVIQFTCHYPEEPVEIYFDADILEKVVGNLLSNAFKYTPSGESVELSVSMTKQGHLHGDSSPERDGMSPAVRIDVKDTGPGIPANKQEVIFERFYQLNHNPGNTIGGVGIGLALTRELLSLHHGLITLESTEGSGSRFSVFLPAESVIFSRDEITEATPYRKSQEKEYVPSVADPLREVVMQEEVTPDEMTGESTLPLVLVVDDNADMRTYIRQVLVDHFTITDAENGNEGFDLACNQVPDLIITDVMMYPVNGIDFCRMVKKDEKTSHIPVIMLTALSGSQEKIEGLETGADDYITKPFSPHELQARIRNLISQRMKLRQLFSSSMNLEPKAISVTSADEKFLMRLIQLIEDNIDNSELDIEFLLQNIAMSRSQLHRKIKALTDQPITGFIRIIRIKRAAQLLEQKFGNVSEVMYAVGFNNLSYFTKSFREVYHMTPSEFMAK